MSIEALQAKKEKLEAQLAAVTEELNGELARQKAQALDEIRQLMKDYGIEPKALVTPRAARKGPAKVRGPQPPKYRDPKTGATWNGYGRAPVWIADAKRRDRFLITAAV